MLSLKKKRIQRSIMQDVAKANEVSLRFETISEITCIGKQYVSHDFLPLRQKHLQSQQ